jgi:hypothetical protein
MKVQQPMWCPGMRGEREGGKNALRSRSRKDWVEWDFVLTNDIFSVF